MSGKIFFVAAVFHDHFVRPMKKKKKQLKPLQYDTNSVKFSYQ